MSDARIRQPGRRLAERFAIRHREVGYTVTVGFGELGDGGTGPVREVFLACEKNTGELQALARDAAIAVSLALQHGCTLTTLAHAMTRETNGDASGIAGAAIDAIVARGLA